MPIYEYACRECHHTFEALVDEGDAVECPQCQARKLERLLSLPARVTPSATAGAACNADPSLPPCGPMCGRWKG